MIQELIVAIIGVIVAIIIIYKIYSFFFVKDERKKSCGCSSCGCRVKKNKIA